MCAKINPTGEPYSLSGSRMAFANWYFVRPCGFGWYDEQGKNVAVAGDQGPTGARFGRTDDPYGISIRANPALRIGPLIDVERPWEEGGVGISTIIHENGVYRGWGSTGWGDLATRGKKYFIYFESTDGYHWSRPECGIVEEGGTRKNNILGKFGGTVFIDPSAPANERYKWIAEAHFPKEVYEEYIRRRPDAVDPRSNRFDANLFIGVRGAVSPDGIHWTVIDQPLVMHHSDTQNICYYDTRLKKYVAYMREFVAGPQAPGYSNHPAKWISVGRRAIARAETDDFRNFPVAELIVEPPPWMSFSEVLYTNGRTTIPKAPDVPLMFPSVWDQSTDATWVALATSHDGAVWNFIPGIKLWETGAFGQWDGGCLFASPNLFELPNGDFALPYTAYNVPHKYPRQKAQRAFGYAVWPKGRLLGIEAKERGAFSTIAVIAPGHKLRINALTQRAGSIRCEAADLDGKAIPGREFENSIPLFGDCHQAPLTWKGHDDLGIEAGTPVILRFRIELGCIYFLDFV